MILTTFLSVSVSMLAPASIEVKPEIYRGWAGAVRISNKYVELVVVPEIGRVMYYGEIRGKNLLWENPALGPNDSAMPGYDNFGGDKLWYAPQTLWTWPPDLGVDGTPHKVELLKDGVRMTSGVGKVFPFQFIREIRLNDVGSEVKFTNKMYNQGPDREASVWQVTQLNNPSRVEIQMDFGTTCRLLMGDKLLRDYHKQEPGKFVVLRHPKKAYKFGSVSKTGTLSATIDRTVFTSTSVFSKRAKYPDGGSMLEVYTNPDPDKYVELEHLSPLLKLGTKEVTIQQVTWRIKNGR